MEKKDLCIACKSDLRDNATLCPTCGSYQSNIRTNLLFVGKIAGFVSLLGALVLYSTSTFIRIINEMSYADDVEVLSFRSNGNSVFYNSGDGDIFLSHIEVEIVNSAIGVDRVHTIQKLLHKGEVLTEKTMFTPENEGRKFTVLKTKSNEEWVEKIKQISRNSGIDLVFYSEESPSLLLYKKRLGNNLRYFDADAEVVFYSIKNKKNVKKQIKNIKAIAVELFDN
jgi:hypothetical protein